MNISEQDLAKMLDLLIPYFKEKILYSDSTSKTAKVINAIVSSEIPQDETKVEVYTPDSPDAKFIVTNPNISIKYAPGDSVQLIYYDSLKTAKIFAKN